MRIFWVLVFAAMMAYVAWWLVYAIRKRMVFEVEMALGVGSLWAAFAAMNLELSELVLWPSALSLAGWAILRELGWGKGAGLEKQVVGGLETLVERGLSQPGTYCRSPRRVAPIARRIVQSLPSLPENPLILDVGTAPGFLCIELAKLPPGAAFIGGPLAPCGRDSTAVRHEGGAAPGEFGHL